MPLNLESKKAIVAEVSAIAQQAASLVVAEYRRLTVADLSKLRIKAREENVYLRIVRNTLAWKAIENTSFACMEKALVGPLIFAFSIKEPGAAAKIFKEFAKSHEHFKVKALSVSGEYYDASHLAAIAALPTEKEAQTLLACTLLAPITQLVRTLNEAPTQLARALNAYVTKQEAA